MRTPVSDPVVWKKWVGDSRTGVGFAIIRNLLNGLMTARMRVG